jgi:Tol biopolymer transport system component
MEKAQPWSRRIEAMRFKQAVTIIAGLLLLGALPAPAQKSDPAEVLFEAARKKEVLEGNLEAAIRQYQEILSRYESNRPVAAKALIQIGLCYEKLGAGEASEAYRRVIANYPERQEEVLTARERLSVLARASGQATAAPRFRKINIPIKLSSQMFGGCLSPDGNTFAFESEGAIWAIPIPGKVSADLAGEPRRLTEVMGAWGHGLSWSADGNWIAFNGIAEGKPVGVRQLYVVPSRGGQLLKMPLDLLPASHYRSFPLSLSPDGKNLAYASWKPNITEISAIPVQGGAPKLMVGAEAYDPSFSPDGKKLAFVRSYRVDTPPKLRAEIRVISLTGGDSVLVTEIPQRARSPIWSPDGKLLAFQIEPLPGSESDELWIVPVSEEGRGTASPSSIKLPRTTLSRLAGWTSQNKIGIILTSPEHQAIYTVPSSGGKATQVTAEGNVEFPKWLPDNSAILFMSEFGMSFGRVPAAGGAMSQVFAGTKKSASEVRPIGGFDISPDGSTIVFSGYAAVGKQPVNLWTMPVAGGEPVGLPQAPGFQDRYPSWVSDGKNVAFVRIGQNKPVVNICVMTVSNGTVRQISSDEDAVQNAPIACSPDGAYVAYFTKGGTVCVKPLAGGPSRILTKVAGTGGIAWSADGKRIAYNADGKIWVISSAGGNPAVIETGLDNASLIDISWSRDGQKLAFTAHTGGAPELWLIEEFLHLVKRPR